MPPVIPPTPTADDQFFWDAVGEGRLVFQRCAGCATLRHPPAPMCGDCHSLEWDTQESAGRGTVYTWIESRHPTKPDREPRLVALVELEEGVRLVSNLCDVEADGVRNGMAVTVCFEHFEAPDGSDVVLPQFRPTGGDGT
jgi:uncharacterized OB-fold protein